MPKFELSIAKDYVPKWNYIDGVRELFQNALDQQTKVEDNKMFFDYDENTKKLSIGNKLSVLDTSTLLLGASTKRNDKETIGQFGEGYKIATLVLTREGHPVTFYNYGAKEVWKPRFVNSRRYKTDVLTFFVDKKYPWQEVPHHNLIIEIENITKEQYDNIVETNLHLQDNGKYFETDIGRILLEDKYKGKVYVNGLYVCDYGEYQYGYDFKPSRLNIDRDRKLVDNFDLRWLASQMWLKQEGNEEMRKLATQLIKDNKADVEYVSNVYVLDGNYQETAEMVYTEFKKEYGKNAIPVSTQEELETITGDYKPVMVAENYKDVVTSSYQYEEPVRIYKLSPKRRLENWLETYRNTLTDQAIQELESIMQDMS